MSRLKVRAYRPTFVSVSTRQLQAIGDGIRASGDDFEFTDNLKDDADVALVVSGPKYPGSRLCADRVEIHGRFNGRTLVSESPFFRRGAQPHTGPDPYFRLSVGGFMRDDGRFHPEGFEADGERWRQIKEEHGLEIKPWGRESPTGPVLICMQKPSDASLRGLNVRQWTETMIARVRERTFLEIVMRAHPLDKTRAGLELRDVCCRWSKEPSLERDLEMASAVITYTSLSAIESVMAGVPTFCLSSANHAWGVSLMDDLSRLAWDDPLGEIGRTPDRQGWLDALSWGQWKLSELKEGTPWRRLKTLLI